MMNQMLLFLNLISAGVIFVHCVCRLSIYQWRLKNPDLWIYALLCGGAVAVFGHSIAQRAVHHPSEIIVNIGLAAYFLSQTWRIWRAGKL